MITFPAAMRFASTVNPSAAERLSRELVSRETLKIILLPTAAAIAYGIVMDQITIRICPEYFTVFHPHILNTGSLTLLALGWGVVATWWAGAIAGIAFALAARASSMPKLTWRYFVRPLVFLAITMAATSVAAGFLGAWMVNTGKIPAVQAWAFALPLDKQAAFMADAFAHVTSYLVSALGCLTIAIAAAWKRYA